MKFQEPASRSVAPIPRTTFPLTREQEGLWVEWKLSPVGDSYNTCIQLRLEGALDVARFRRAIAEVVAGFDLLRAYCVEEDGVPRLALAEETFQLEVVDLTAGPAPETPARRQRAMAELTRRRDAAIDLTVFPLIRAALLQTDPQTFYFIGVVPHIISDGYAAVAILQAISVAYEGGAAGLREAYGDARKDWADYLALRGAQPAAEHAAARSHWQAVLEGAAHTVPVGRAAEAGVADTRGLRHFFSFPASRLKRFIRLARSRRTSVFAVFAALYATLLYRQTSQTDLIIVFPVNVRPPGFRQTFGLFVNMLPLRVDLAGNPTFAELVEQIGNRRRQDKPHQHLPGLDIVRARREQVADFDGRLSNVSMAQTVSRFQGLDISGVRCSALDNDAIHVRDDLSLMYEVGPDVVGLWLEYRESAFSADDVEAMAGRLLRIAEAADADPDVRVGSIPLLDAGEREAVLALGRGPAVPVVPASYGDLFEASALRHADWIAIQHGDEQVSYAALEHRSRVLAARFLQRPGPVAIALERSPTQLIAMLAALRAGQPYVPLLPNQGVARLGAILEELQPTWLIGEAASLAGLGETWSGRTLTPGDPAFDAGDPRALPDLPAVPWSTTAYLIYTSGSTGAPKGVQVSHAALAQRLQWLLRTFALAPDEAVLQNTSFAFDVSVAEILWPLLAGARLVLSEPRRAREPGYLRALIEHEHITTVLMVPSALQALLPRDGDESRQLASLKRVLCAGEPLTLGLARDVLRLTGARLFNVYGPTEAAIYATCREILPEHRHITIGRPIANTSVAVVNDQLCLQPVGLEGELCLSGPGLADGYRQQPQLTATTFVDGVIDGGRWYRTGDRVRMTADGELSFLGRADDQIKLRGYRVELGEIEHVLRTMPGVADAAVVVQRDDRDAPQRLIAWVSSPAADPPPPGHPLAAGHWRETLGRYLPEYMLPSRLQWLAALPRLPSGKLDPARLPQLDDVGGHRSDPPATIREQAMAAIWAEVLGVPVAVVGRHSNFFELGGDSLMLIALASRLERIGIYLEVADLFEHPSIAAALPRAGAGPRTLIDQAPVQGRFPLLPRHHKFFADGFAHPAHWNRSFVLRFPRPIDAAALQRSLEAVVRHHDGLRATFPDSAQGRRCMVVHATAGTAPQLERYDLTGLDAEQRRQHLIRRLDAINAGFDLTSPLLLRAVLFEEENRSTLGLVVHHLLIDMRSCQILLEDLIDAYRASVAQRPLRLPAKTTSAAEWAERLARLVDEGWRADEVAFWAAQLERVGHPIPFDRQPGSTAVDGNQHTLEGELDEPRTEHLVRSLCPEAGMGVHEALLATFAAAFREWSGSSWLVVNTCGVGREAWLEGVDLSRTVGELNTVFPIAIDLRQDDVLACVHGAYAALPAQGRHYGLLRYLGGHAELARPEPEVFFNYVSRLAADTGVDLGVEVDMAPAGVRSSHPGNRNCYALYVEGFVRDDRLVVHLGFDGARFGQQTVQRLLDAWLRELAQQADSPALRVDGAQPVEG